MADYSGSIGLDISKFEEGIVQLQEEIPALEAEIAHLNAEMALMERIGKTGGAEYARMGRVQKELAAQLAVSRKQLEAFNQVARPSKLEAISQGFSKIKSALSFLGVSLTVGALSAFGKSILNFAKEVQTGSTVAGTSAENFQRLQAALSDKLSADDTSDALRQLNSLMLKTKAGSAEAQEKLAQLGISFQDIQSKSPDEIFRKIADYVANSTDKTEALRAVTNAFGDDLGAKLIPALEKGSSEIKRLGDAATVAGDAQVAAAAAGARALDRWGAAVKQNVLMSIAWWDKYFAKVARGRDKVGKMIGESMASRVIVPPGTDLSNLGQSGKPSPNTQKSSASAAPAKESPKEFPSAQIGGPLQHELELLKQQSEIALKMIPDFEKQAQILDAQRKSLESKLAILDKSRVKERAELELQIATNEEAKRSWQLAKDLLDVQIELNNRRAVQGRGHEEKQKTAMAEIAALAKQYEIASRKDDKAAMSAIMAERREKIRAIIDEENAYKDANRQIENQTKEMEAQAKGLTGLASTYSEIEKFQQAILKAYREQNFQAAALLEKQAKISQRAHMASMARETPKDRIAARSASRAEARDARRQERREEEAEKAYQRGARGRRIDELRDSRKARIDAQKARKEASQEVKNERMQEAMNAVIAIKDTITKDS